MTVAAPASTPVPPSTLAVAKSLKGCAHNLSPRDTSAAHVFHPHSHRRQTRFPTGHRLSQKFAHRHAPTASEGTENTDRGPRHGHQKGLQKRTLFLLTPNTMGPISCPFAGPKTHATKVTRGSGFPRKPVCFLSGVCPVFCVIPPGLLPQGGQGQCRPLFEAPSKQSVPTSPAAQPLSLAAIQGSDKNSSPRRCSVRQHLLFHPSGSAPTKHNPMVQGIS